VSSLVRVCFVGDNGGFTSSAPGEFLLLPRLGTVVSIMFLFRFSMLSFRPLKVVFPPELRFMGGDALCLARRLSRLSMIGDCRPVEILVSGLGDCRPVEIPVSGLGDCRPVEVLVSGLGDCCRVEILVSGPGDCRRVEILVSGLGDCCPVEILARGPGSFMSLTLLSLPIMALLFFTGIGALLGERIEDDVVLLLLWFSMLFPLLFTGDIGMFGLTPAILASDFILLKAFFNICASICASSNCCLVFSVNFFSFFLSSVTCASWR